MVMLATCLNEGWSLPLGYFLISAKFTAEERAIKIMECINKLNPTGAVVTNIVMDNCPVNQKTVLQLGADLNPDNLNCLLNIHNVLGQKIVLIMDPLDREGGREEGREEGRRRDREGGGEKEEEREGERKKER